MAGVTSVSSLAQILRPAPYATVPGRPDSTTAAPAATSSLASLSTAPLPRSPPTVAHGLLAPGVLSSLLPEQSVAESAAAATQTARATATAALSAYAAARGLPARPAAPASITQLEGVVIYTS